MAEKPAERPAKQHFRPRKELVSQYAQVVDAGEAEAIELASELSLSIVKFVKSADVAKRTIRQYCPLT